MSMRMEFSLKKKRALLARKISVETRARIDSEKFKSKQKSSKGARAIFLEKYRVTGDINSAKKELDDNGFNSTIYGDKVFQTWIDEDRDK